MIKNYLKMVLRGMRKKKVTPIVIITSFALGLASINILSTFVIYEFSTDSFHGKKEHIFRLLSDDPFNKGALSTQINSKVPPMMKLEYPEVINYCQTSFYSTKDIKANSDEYNTKIRILEVTPSFFEIFDFGLRVGSYPKIPGQILLNEKEAEKYFGNENPVGKEIIIKKNKDSIAYEVTGVLKDLSYNTHFAYDFISCLNNDNYDKGPAYLLLSESFVPKLIKEKIQEFGRGFSKTNNEYHYSYHLQSLEDVYFDVDNKWNENYRGSSFVYTFLSIGFIILLIASFNYINLLKLRFTQKQKEMILRKILGEPKSVNFLPLYLELCIYMVSGLILSFAISALLLGYFNNITGSNISTEFIFNQKVIISYMSLLLFFSLIFFVYVYLYFNKRKSAEVFSSIRVQKKKRIPVLQVIQFVVSVSLVAAVYIIMQQVEYVQNKELGFDRDVYEFRIPGSLKASASEFKNELIQYPFIEGVSIASGSPVLEYAKIMLQYDPEDENKTYSPSVFWGDVDYSNVLGLKLILGEYFNPDVNNDNNCLINESLAKKYFRGNPLGSKVPGTDYIIVGVVKDFHCETFSSLISPGFVVCDNSGRNILIKFKPGMEKNGLKQIQKWWTENIDNYSFQYHTLSERFEQMHSDISNDAELIKLFAVISIVLSVLGLLAYTIIRTQERIKEIGVRKVVGASVLEILILLFRDTLKWIIAASVISIPIILDIMNVWLNNFVYRIEIDWKTFLFSGGLILFVALAVVSFHAIKAATANPIESLKYE